MNGNVNKILLLGNVGNEPELRYTAKGNAVLSLSIATHRFAKAADGTKSEETHWHKASVWGKRAETCSKYLAKGSRVFIQGELQMKNWTDKDGKVHKSAEIYVDDVRFLDGTRRDQASTAEEAQIPMMTH